MSKLNVKSVRYWVASADRAEDQSSLHAHKMSAPYTLKDY